MEDKKTFTADNLPDDFNVSSTKNVDFEPIDPSETYTVQVIKAEIRENVFYKPDEKDFSKKGEKYQFSFEFAILDDNEYYGRRLWDTTGTSFKPEGKRGPTKLFKIVTCAMRVEMGWNEVNSFNPDTKTFVLNLQKEVVGKQLKVAIENVPKKDGKLRSKITTYNRVKKELKAFDPEKAKKLGEEIKAKAAEKGKKMDENVNPNDTPF